MPGDEDTMRSESGELRQLMPRYEDTTGNANEELRQLMPRDEDTAGNASEELRQLVTRDEHIMGNASDELRDHMPGEEDTMRSAGDDGASESQTAMPTVSVEGNKHSHADADFESCEKGETDCQRDRGTSSSEKRNVAVVILGMHESDCETDDITAQHPLKTCQIGSTSSNESQFEYDDDKSTRHVDGRKSDLCAYLLRTDPGNDTSPENHSKPVCVLGSCELDSKPTDSLKSDRESSGIDLNCSKSVIFASIRRVQSQPTLRRCHKGELRSVPDQVGVDSEQPTRVPGSLKTHSCSKDVSVEKLQKHESPASERATKEVRRAQSDLLTEFPLETKERETKSSNRQSVARKWTRRLRERVADAFRRLKNRFRHSNSRAH